MAEEEDERQRQRKGEEEGEGRGGAVKYKDVFEMSGEMAEQPISPRDAAAMRSAENRAFGKTLKDGPASLMLHAAAKNLQAGLVPPLNSSSSSLPQVRGNPWHGSQLAHERMESALSALSIEGISAQKGTGVTIGEALEAVAEAIGDKPVDRSDAAAIQIAEKIATGTDVALGSGLGAEAQACATANARLEYDEDKTKLYEILEGATNMLTGDKEATKEDAERVKAAELRGGYEGLLGEEELRRHGTRQSTTPGGVAEAVESAAKINNPDN